MKESIELRDEQQIYQINCRIRMADTSLGTVRYIGEVHGQRGIWLGIEWDDPLRGKHNGTIDGHVYFQTSHPTSASMIRPGGKICPYESVFQAIENRYILSINSDTDSNLLAETKKLLQASIFEVVGMDKIKQKQSQWQDLDMANISYSNVNVAGDLNFLIKLTELDLTATLISSWSIIADITRQIPTLKKLDLSNTRLQLPTDNEIKNLQLHFHNIAFLNLRRCRLESWQQLLYIAQLWPNIKGLALQENNLIELQTPDTSLVFKNLENLDLQLNGIHNFQEILKLINIKTLKSLNLNNNNFKTIDLPDCEPNKQLNIFENLTELHLKNNPINDECHVFNELDKLRSFERLFISVKPLIGFENIYSNAVSRINNLKMLNSMEITEVGKRGAEYDLWKQFGQEWIRSDDTERKCIAQKTRTYPTLVKKYGSPAELTSAPPKLSNLITIKMKSSFDDNFIIKRVSRKMSVQALQGIALRLLNSHNTATGAASGITMPKLSYLDSSRCDISVTMDNLSKTLDYYSIQDGDTVLVEW